MHYAGYIFDLPKSSVLFGAWSGITKFAEINVRDFAELRTIWKGRDNFSRMVIGRITVTKPLTEAQKRRLPKDLRAKLA
jgi:hypothetical protein